MVKLVRLPINELNHRQALRQKYFEDPNYRRWSDIVTGGINDLSYKSWSDDLLFDYFITGQSTGLSNLSTIQNHLKNSYKLPINWSNFYAYFDEQLNDPENRYIEELTQLLISDNDGHRSNIKGLLDKYRDKIFSSYDLI